MKSIHGTGVPIWHGWLIMMLLAGLGGCVPAPVAPKPAAAETSLSKCASLDLTGWQRTKDCTAVIYSRDTTPIDLQRALYLRGVAYQEFERPDYAIKDFNRAIQLNPNDFNALRDRCGAYVDDVQPDLAIQDCDRAMLLGRGAPDPLIDLRTVFLNRGRAYAAKAEYGRAIVDFSRGLPSFACIGETCYLLLMNRGRAYRALGQSRQAEADFVRARRTLMSID